MYAICKATAYVIKTTTMNKPDVEVDYEAVSCLFYTVSQKTTLV